MPGYGIRPENDDTTRNWWVFMGILVVGLTIGFVFVALAIPQGREKRECQEWKTVNLVIPIGHRNYTTYYLVFHDGTAMEWGQIGKSVFSKETPVVNQNVCVKW